MPTIILSTFAMRDASERELAAESASQSAAVETKQSLEPAHSEIQTARRIECRGLLRGHMRGAKLEIFLGMSALAAKRGGITWIGPAWINRAGICASPYWARKLLKALVSDGWLEEIEWNNRRAYRVRTHAEWARITGACDAGLSPLCGERTATKWCESRHSLASKPLTCHGLSADRSECEDQEVQDQSVTSYCISGPSELLRKHITAKIAKTDSTWESYLAEENEKSRTDLRQKFAWVCRFLEFKIAENDGSLGWEFPLMLIELYKEHRDALRSGDLTRGRFACKVIDRCERDKILWPPAFTEVRDRWRQIERASEVNSSVEAA